MPATDQQVQNFVDQRLRPRCEQIRALVASLADDIAEIDQVYQALTQQNPTWADNRTDGPPNLLTVGDVLSINAMLHTAHDAIANSGDWATVQKACVRPISV